MIQQMYAQCVSEKFHPLTPGAETTSVYNNRITTKDYETVVRQVKEQYAKTIEAQQKPDGYLGRQIKITWEGGTVVYLQGHGQLPPPNVALAKCGNHHIRVLCIDLKSK